MTNLTCAVLDQTIERLGRAGRDPSVWQALREPKRVWTYAKLAEEVARAAGAFRSFGLVPGDRVVLLMHDGAELAAALLGAVRAGLCAVPLSDTSRPRELGEVLRDSAASLVLAHADLSERVEQVQSSAPSVRHVLSLGGTRPGQLDFAALCFDADPHFDPVLVGDDIPALILYHSSPSGKQSGYGYPHEVPLISYKAYGDSVLMLDPEDRVFSTARLASSLGIAMNLLYPLLAGAVSYLLPDQVRSRAIFDVLGSFKPTVFTATPTVYSQMVRDFMEISAPRPSYFKSVRLAVSGAEPLPPSLERRLRGVFQIEPVHGFSTTEAFHMVLSNPPRAGEGRSGSCGRPLPGIEARVMNEQGLAAAPAEIGNLELRGDPLRGGIWCGLTRRVLTVSEGEWIPLSDRFFVDADGFFFHVGRSDGMFKVAGKLVSPTEVEQTLLGHPAVWECAVNEDQDEDGLPIPKAYVVLNVGSEPSARLARELIDFVRRQLSPHKSPRQVEFLSQLPRGPEGQVARWRLRSRPPVPSITPPSGQSPVRIPDRGDKGGK